mgnify:CR=1 FL=1
MLRLPDLGLTADRQADLLADYRARSEPFAEPDPALREACEDVILNRDPDATERLITLAESFKGKSVADEKAAEEGKLEKYFSEKPGAGD